MNQKKKMTSPATRRNSGRKTRQIDPDFGFPTTPDEVDRYEAQLDVSSAPTPDVNRFMRYLDGEKYERATPGGNVVQLPKTAIG